MRWLPPSVGSRDRCRRVVAYGSGGLHEFENEYEPYRGWGCHAWGPFNEALRTAMRIVDFGAPAPRLIARAYRAGKTPGLEPVGLRKAAALLIRYADAIEAQPKK